MGLSLMFFCITSFEWISYFPGQFPYLPHLLLHSRLRHKDIVSWILRLIISFISSQFHFPFLSVSRRRPKKRTIYSWNHFFHVMTLLFPSSPTFHGSCDLRSRHMRSAPSSVGLYDSLIEARWRLSPTARRANGRFVGLKALWASAFGAIADRPLVLEHKTISTHPCRERERTSFRVQAASGGD